VATPALEREILTLLVEGLATLRSVLACLRHLLRQASRTNAARSAESTVNQVGAGSAGD
jgi:hypothetical protein